MAKLRPDSTLQTVSNTIGSELHYWPSKILSKAGFPEACVGKNLEISLPEVLLPVLDAVQIA